MLNYLYDFDFTSLFVDELGWDYPSNNEIELTIENQNYHVKPLAEKYGFVIYECRDIDINEIPNISTRCKINEVITEYTYEHLLIYIDPIQQIWQWNYRQGNSVIYQEYLFQDERDSHDLLNRLYLLAFEISEEVNLTIFKVIKKVTQAFNNNKNESKFINSNQLMTAYHYIVIGDYMMNQNENELALRCYEKVLRVIKDDYEVWHSQGKVLVELGCYDDALISYDNSLNLNPDNYLAWYDRGDLLSEYQGDFSQQEEAIKSYDKALEIEPNTQTVWYRKGIVFYFLSEYEEAINCFNIALEINPNDYFAWTWKGQALYQLDEKEEAIYSYDKAIEINPDYWVAWKDKGETLEELGRYQAALSSYNTSISMSNFVSSYVPYVRYVRDKLLDKIQNDKKSNRYKILQAKKLNNQASRLNEGEKYEEALFSINAALKLNPKLYQAWYNKGLILRNLDRYNDAINSHIEAFRLCDNDFDMPYEIACCYALQSKVKKAVEYLKIAIAASPEVYINQARSDSDFDLIRDSPSFKALVSNNEEKAYEFYKQAQERMIYGEYDKATISFGKFLKLQPDHAEAIYEIACCYALQNKVQKAVEHLKKAIALSPDIYLTKARTDSSFELIRHRSSFKSLVSSDEGKAGDLYTQAKVMMAIENYKQAITIYDKALKLKPDNVIALLDKGFALFKLEFYDEALKNLQIATDLDTKGYVWHILDSVYCQFSDHENIFTCYSEACKTNPYSPEILYGMGRVYSLRKIYVDAASCYEEALNLNPLLLPARVELSQVNKKLDDERNRRIEQEKKRKDEEQKRVKQELKRKAEEQKRIEQENKQKAEEKEKQKREEDRRNREKKKSRDPVSQVLGFIKKIFF
jgi:tetratricopeptide (TPR) repeat protein